MQSLIALWQAEGEILMGLYYDNHTRKYLTEDCLGFKCAFNAPNHDAAIDWVVAADLVELAPGMPIKRLV